MKHNDVVRRLTTIPQCSIGAPLPVVLADEQTAIVAFYLENREPDWDGTTLRLLDAVTSIEPVGIVRFNSCYALTFGPPNDEAFAGHPLAALGLKPYGAFEIEHSSWLAELERRNSVHPHHTRDRFMLNKKHFILSFHDSVVECIAESFDVSIAVGPLHSLTSRMQELLEGAA